MSLEKYISDLLYRYDLVIVPGFGGIIGRKKPARFDRDTYIFSPPHKDLSFNGQLKDNDGLLVNYISHIENISHAEALANVKATVNEWKHVLKTEKRLKLNQIGIFNLLNEDKIIFLPLMTKNYLAEAYGLTSFVHKPVSLPEKEQALSAPVSRDAKSIVKSQPKTYTAKPRVKRRQKNNNNYNLLKYAAVFVIGIGLFTAGIKMYQTGDKNIAEPAFQKATFVLQKDFPVVNIKQTKSENLPVKTEKQTDRFFIISGAFRNKDNAETKLKQLQTKGYPAQIIGQNKFGLWMVAYRGFNDKEQAAKILKQVKQHQPSAWIFAKN